MNGAYVVGLGDSPMSIAGRLSGDPMRYGELLAANPHKPLTFVAGLPTFASLGVGERIALPPGWAAPFGTGAADWQPGALRVTGLTCALGLGDVGLSDLFSDIGHAVNKAVSDVGRAAGHAAGDIAHTAGQAASDAQKAVASAGKFVQDAGGDAGKFVSDAANKIAKDPMGAIARIASSGPLGLVVNPDALRDLLAHVPGVSEVAKFIPSMPDPAKMATNILSAVASGDLNRLKTSLIDVGHEVADIAAMVPGIGNAIGGPFDAALTLLETGSPLKAAFDLLLEQVPGIPPDIRDVLLRPAIDTVADVIEKHESITDVFVSGFKEGIMEEAEKRGIPDELRKLIGDVINGVIQLIFHHKPLKQVATGFLEQGLGAALSAAGAQVKLPPEVTKPVDDLRSALESAKSNAIKQFGDLSKLPADVKSSIDHLSQQYDGAFNTAVALLPPDVAAKLNNAKRAAADIGGVANEVSDLSSLTQAITHLNGLDPHKLDSAIQKQIADLRADIEARKAGIQAHKQALDSNLGARPARAHRPAPPVAPHAPAPPAPPPQAALPPWHPPPPPPPPPWAVPHHGGHHARHRRYHPYPFGYPAAPNPPLS